METKTLFGRLETKFALQETATGTMSGYGAVFGNIDSYGDIIAPGAFTTTLAEHKAAGTMPPMLLGHNMAGLPIGAWDSMEEDAYGLKVSGRFLPSQIGQDARITAAAGEIKGLSIGFIVTNFEMRGGNRVILEVKLIEVSLVTMAANNLACVSDIKSQENNMTKEVTVEVNVKADEALAKLRELKGGLVDLQTLLNCLVIEAKGFQEEGDDCDDDDDCEDGCSCSDDGECQCDDTEELSASEDDQETKYDEAVMSALFEARRGASSLFQK